MHLISRPNRPQSPSQLQGIQFRLCFSRIPSFIVKFRRRDDLQHRQGFSLGCVLAAYQVSLSNSGGGRSTVLLQQQQGFSLGCFLAAYQVSLSNSGGGRSTVLLQQQQ
eukprot:CCRYP_005736-RA/>CCRYP_005736-RA protein AED:0.20 eAED:0.20 QI:193/1/1/1/0/0/3/38/107